MLERECGKYYKGNTCNVLKEYRGKNSILTVERGQW